MILWIIIGIILIITGAVVIISSPDKTPIQTPTPVQTPTITPVQTPTPTPVQTPTPTPVAPSITYTGPTEQTWPSGVRTMWVDNVPINEIYYNNNYSLPFRLTFPAGTTRVRVTPSGVGTENFSVIQFDPAVTDTTEDVLISYISNASWVRGYVWFELFLNNDTTPSASSRWYISTYIL